MYFDAAGHLPRGVDQGSILLWNPQFWYTLRQGRRVYQNQTGFFAGIPPAFTFLRFLLKYRAFIKGSVIADPLWPHRLTVRTLPLQGSNTGSIPVGAATLSVAVGTLSVPPFRFSICGFGILATLSVAVSRMLGVSNSSWLSIILIYHHPMTWGGGVTGYFTGYSKYFPGFCRGRHWCWPDCFPGWRRSRWRYS